MDEGLLKRFETVYKLDDGREVIFRPLRTKKDLDALYQFYSVLSKEKNYRRFMGYRKVTRWIVEDWVDIDYYQKMSLVAVVDRGDSFKIVADSRYYVDKTTGAAEIAIVVQDDWQHKGIGTNLLLHTIEVAREMGVKKLFAYVAPENRKIIRMGKKLGFAQKWYPEMGEYGGELILNE
ncbi:MAG: GNAT family N-acetyltransferase [Candidatus Jordarchaeum sp.]|uniref:GNAT family N-acetyltransferase n=1 Tax=Candidatus Jordarchaeum sp. TaxID=2823881 RepID=UPI004049CC3F